MRRFLYLLILIVGIGGCSVGVAASDSVAPSVESHPWSAQDYLVFDEEYLVNSVNTVRGNGGKIVDVVGYLFLTLLSVYVLIWLGSFFVR